MKPCPFCGSDDVGYSYRKHPDGHEMAMVACGHCGANGPVRTYLSEWDDDEAEASWDKRHNVELTGAARLYRAASSDRRERG
jgi:Lar family restriction alleviation protein